MFLFVFDDCPDIMRTLLPVYLHSFLRLKFQCLFRSRFQQNVTNDYVDKLDVSNQRLRKKNRSVKKFISIFT